MRKLKVTVSLIMVVFMMLTLGCFSIIQAASFSGAIFTTDSTGNTNVNLYADKELVHLNGGPMHTGAAGLPNGNYYVQVTDPSGSNILGSSLNAPSGLETPILVENGEFIHPYRLRDIVFRPGEVAGFDDTTNGGGVYKVWVSRSTSFDSDESKTDNFRVKNGGDDPMDGSVSGYKFEDLNFNGLQDTGEPRLKNWEISLYLEDVLIDTVMTNSNGEFMFGFLQAGSYKLMETMQPGWKQTAPPDGYFSFSLAKSEVKTGKAFGNTQNGKLRVKKFYDANANGYWDSGEQLLEGWKVNISGGPGDIFTTWSAYIKAGPYTVTEYKPVQPCWIATTDTSVDIELGLTEEETVKFGNICIGPGGGHTLGFWSNKNGQKLIDADDFTVLVTLNLRNADGTEFDPPTKEDFRKWILDCKAANMANMLSAQLAAMKLNVLNGFVDDNSLIWVGENPYYPIIKAVTVNQLMDAANASLGSYGSTPSGSDQRAFQEAMKTALDNANNNKNFIQPFPCPFSF